MHVALIDNRYASALMRKDWTNQQQMLQIQLCSVEHPLKQCSRTNSISSRTIRYTLYQLTKTCRELPKMDALPVS